MLNVWKNIVIGFSEDTAIPSMVMMSRVRWKNEMIQNSDLLMIFRFCEQQSSLTQVFYNFVVLSFNILIHFNFPVSYLLLSIRLKCMMAKE